MGKRKSSSDSGISDREILAMYEAILPLLSHNPEGIDVANQINKRVLSFVQFDFLHYLMEDTNAPSKALSTSSTRFAGFGELRGPQISVRVEREDVEDFDEKVVENYNRIRERRRPNHPDQKDFHYHEIKSELPPKIAVGFARSKAAQASNGFTAEELQRFDRLAPHILSLFRTVLTQVMQSSAFQYFDSFAKIGSRIANELGLSDAETKLIPDILFGFSNEEIAERHFVSVATVKTHINHILKKTGTKNRIEFLGKFFTSPENLQL